MQAAFKGPEISIHALLAESDYTAIVKHLLLKISIHALLAESDLLILPGRFTRSAFLSTLSLRRATRTPASRLLRQSNFYPRSPCGERLKEVEKLSRVTVISIHALLAESDSASAQTRLVSISFLSTLSLRIATSAAAGKRAGCYYFYPRSPCGERHTGPG